MCVCVCVFRVSRVCLIVVMVTESSIKQHILLIYQLMYSHSKIVHYFLIARNNYKACPIIFYFIHKTFSDLLHFFPDFMLKSVICKQIFFHKEFFVLSFACVYSYMQFICM